MRSSIAVLATMSACYIEPDEPRFTNIAFVTSQAIPFDTLGGIAGADALCNADAQAAGLPGDYLAWLSEDVAAPVRFPLTARGWKRTDGKPFVDRLSDLLAGRIYYPLAIDENGDDVIEATLTDQTPVATATRASGITAEACSGDPPVIQFGAPDGTTERWTENGTTSCSTRVRLYCFGVDVDGPVDPPTETGRLAFLSTNLFTGDTGPAVADQECNDEAHRAGLSGDYAALIGQIGQTLGTDFAPGPPWVRPDGVLASVDLHSLVAPVNVQLDGSYVGGEYVWTGSTGFDDQIEASDNCSDWVGAFAGGFVGIASRSANRSLDDTGGIDCSEPHFIYCFER